ncbi:biofilm regulation diguanylate cyclase SiaD [Halomonas maura]|uniref:biofilm regulation diguanylate cyclase SiaD n=1 Tax=Halomonas maura TaxID=117606 RepID=UPI0025B2B0D0|nr:biofilm regulation diguanylate cyclase SiaD [Halomonas maura]MDN3556392.1 biofilm regulation diguanylate cyclase SiaD [Halomonas maura]
MTPQDQALLDRVAALIDSDAYRGHPLHEALSQLYAHHLEQRERLERLINIADGYQQTAHEDLDATRHQLQRQLKRQRKLSRIADRYQALLRERNDALVDAATLDPLTGLANRRLIDEQLQHLAADAQRHARPFTLAMIDIDHFKRVNDHHGHAAGDRLLVALAKALAGELRAVDHCARWGGEEFLVVLPATSLDQAEPLVTRLCERLRALSLTFEGKRLRLTASIGVAQHRLDDDVATTIQRADEALLIAKREGRDRWRVAD